MEDAAAVKMQTSEPSIVAHLNAKKFAARVRSRSMLRRATTRLAPALWARSIKSSTGVVGLEVEPNAKPILVGLYTETLAAIQPIPVASEYRKYVEGLTKERLAVVESTDDLDEIEATVGCGQVEQLIQQAKDELNLIPNLIAANAFAPYDGSPPEDILMDLKRCAAREKKSPSPIHPRPPASLVTDASRCPLPVVRPQAWRGAAAR